MALAPAPVWGERGRMQVLFKLFILKLIKKKPKQTNKQTKKQTHIFRTVFLKQSLVEVEKEKKKSCLLYTGSCDKRYALVIGLW